MKQESELQILRSAIAACRLCRDAPAKGAAGRVVSGGLHGLPVLLWGDVGFGPRAATRDRRNASSSGSRDEWAGSTAATRVRVPKTVRKMVR